MELWKLKDELHAFALSLCDDLSLADDIVQETFLFSIENNINDKERLLSACQQLAKNLKKLTRRDPGSAINKYAGGK